jgi:hypothetical protein
MQQKNFLGSNIEKPQQVPGFPAFIDSVQKLSKKVKRR